MTKTITIFTGLVKINKNLVGTAVVYHELASFLIKAKFKVNLVLPEDSDNKLKGANYYIYNESNNKKLIKKSSIVIFGSYPPVNPLNYAAKCKKKIITYMWSIAPIGSLEFKDFKSSAKQVKLHSSIVDSYNLSLELSNKIFCRDQKAKDLLLGSLISLKRAGLSNYTNRSFDHLLEIAPFGLEQGRPEHKKNIYRNILPGVDKEDYLLIWNGGVWNWNDGISLVKTMKYLSWPRPRRGANKKIKLIFQGFHNPDKIYSAEAKKTKKLSDKLKLTDKNIFFPENWIIFSKRGNFLTECNLGIVTSPDIPEANYFTKTRFYDYLWAELPIVLYPWEAFTSQVEKHGLGLTLTSDPKKDAALITKFSSDKKLHNQIKLNIKKYKKNLTWQKGLKPVIDYCKKV